MRTGAYRESQKGGEYFVKSITNMSHRGAKDRYPPPLCTPKHVRQTLLEYVRRIGLNEEGVGLKRCFACLKGCVKRIRRIGGQDL